MCVPSLTAFSGRLEAWGCAASVHGLLSTVHRPPALSIHLAGWKTCPTAVCRLPSAVWIDSFSHSLTVLLAGAQRLFSPDRMSPTQYTHDVDSHKIFNNHCLTSCFFPGNICVNKTALTALLSREAEGPARRSLSNLFLLCPRAHSVSWHEQKNRNKVLIPADGCSGR
jgi:hypothetical protein